jgi:hypothetical protein
MGNRSSQASFRILYTARSLSFHYTYNILRFRLYDVSFNQDINPVYYCRFYNMTCSGETGQCEGAA